MTQIDDDNPFLQQYQTQDDKLKENRIQPNRKVFDTGRKTMQAFQERKDEFGYKDSILTNHPS